MLDEGGGGRPRRGLSRHRHRPHPGRLPCRAVPLSSKLAGPRRQRADRCPCRRPRSCPPKNGAANAPSPRARACCIHFRHRFRCERARARTSNAVAPTSCERPRAMIARARQRMNAPVFETTEGHVLIGDSAHLTGLTPATLVLCRLRERLLPHARLLRRHRDHPGQAEARPCYRHATPLRRRRQGDAAPGRPAGSLPSGLVEAETLKLEIGRAKLRRGERIAVTAPSIYLADIDPGCRNLHRRSCRNRSRSTLILRPLRRGDTAAPLPPPHAPLASGRPPSPHTPAPAFIRPPGPAPIEKALVEADELPAGSPESSCLGRRSSESPRQGRLALQGIWGAQTSPSGGFSSYSESFTYAL